MTSVLWSSEPIEVYLSIIAAGAGDDFRDECRESIPTMQTELVEQMRMTQVRAYRTKVVNMGSPFNALCSTLFSTP